MREACARCNGPASPGRSACVACARAIADEVGSSFLREVARYWERRMMQGRRGDWT